MDCENLCIGMLDELLRGHRGLDRRAVACEELVSEEESSRVLALEGACSLNDFAFVLHEEALYGVLVDDFATLVAWGGGLFCCHGK